MNFTFPEISLNKLLDQNMKNEKAPSHKDCNSPIESIKSNAALFAFGRIVSRSSDGFSEPTLQRKENFF